MMRPFAFALLLVTFTFVFTPSAAALSPLAYRPCNVAYRCTNELKPVWVANGDSCLGFRNQCFLASANCDRQNNYEEVLKEISREKCKDLCPDRCHEDDDPVCGYLDEDRQTFDNSCEMEKYSCETGLPYELYSEGQCKRESLGSAPSKNT